MDGYLRAMRNYAGFAGRASRAEFWQFVVVLTAMFVVVTVLGGSPQGRSIWDSFPVMLLCLVHVVPSFAVTVRRLHDADYAGWWALLNLVPFGNFVVLAFGCLPGTPGPNRYGAEPLAAPAGAALPPTSGSPPARASHDPVAEIERLAALKASGALSETEFEVMKAQALHGGRAG